MNGNFFLHAAHHLFPFIDPVNLLLSQRCRLLYMSDLCFSHDLLHPYVLHPYYIVPDLDLGGTSAILVKRKNICEMNNWFTFKAVIND